MVAMNAQERERMKEVRMVLKKEMMSASWKAVEKEYLKERSSVIGLVVLLGSQLGWRTVLSLVGWKESYSVNE